MEHDTNLGGPATGFPLTHGSLVRATANADAVVRRQAHGALIAAYWKPVYKYVRVRWRRANEDAKDLTQAFFAVALEKAFFERFDPARARFRTFVRLCVDSFVAKEQRAGERLKRGGGVTLLSLDFDGAEGELRRQEPADDRDPDDFFRQEWVRGLFAAAVDDLRHHCAAAGKQLPFQLFERYDLEGPDAVDKPTYAGLSREFGASETQVTNHLAYARRLFRQLALDRLRAATATDDEFHDEVRRLFGGEGR